MANPGGTFTLGGDLPVTRMGYGTMQLTGPGVWGPPRDHDTAVAVLREAVERGVTHLDTSNYFGPHTVNTLIKEALRPYPESLVIVTKVGARRSADKGWPAALSAEDLTRAVHDDLRNLGVDALGGFSPPQSGLLDDCAARAGATPMQVAPAWLPRRSPSMLLIPGTSSPEHLRENLAAADLELPGDVLADLDRIGTA
ncbi:aldo/keto reductase [Amycolatopsis vastitatis]|uniref:NADP-dependent oxidoreductase domain-containing protein n=1 Tax=Amycolatopsis vastitatis TaxID=1905142 RepID=A0A229T8X3_9PSEU|nr:aldo/keto reductase [Amycolatopsis vastitatis]OXM67391.1 hypothetical protein CF165_17145 [Amycolatopsis vastitatis]